MRSTYLFSFILLLMLASCSTPEKLLCRTWRPTDIDFDETQLSYDPSMKGEIIQQLKDTLVLTFHKDHTYRLQLPDRAERGTWRFNDTNDTLYTNNENSGGLTKINSLTKEFLNVESHDKNGMDMKFIFQPVKTKK